MGQKIGGLRAPLEALSVSVEPALDQRRYGTQDRLDSIAVSSREELRSPFSLNFSWFEMPRRNRAGETT